VDWLFFDSVNAVFLVSFLEKSDKSEASAFSGVPIFRHENVTNFAKLFKLPL
jgi:hypothetical protein